MVLSETSQGIIWINTFQIHPPGMETLQAFRSLASTSWLTPTSTLSVLTKKLIVQTSRQRAIYQWALHEHFLRILIRIPLVRWFGFGFRAPKNGAQIRKIKIFHCFEELDCLLEWLEIFVYSQKTCKKALKLNIEFKPKNFLVVQLTFINIYLEKHKSNLDPDPLTLC